MRIIGNLLGGSSEVSKLPSVISPEVWLLHVPLSAFLGENSISRWPRFRSHHSARMWSWDFKVIRRN